jgi:hypothetical protein
MHACRAAMLPTAQRNTQHGIVSDGHGKAGVVLRT